jgi:hypothetical protein
MKRKHSELMAYLKQETCSIEAIIVSLSAQVHTNCLSDLEYN